MKKTIGLENQFI